MKIQNKGFTLIEILVVMVLISFMAGFILIYLIPDQNKKLTEESTRLRQVLTLASDFSRLAGKKIAWQSNGREYFFLAEEIKDNKIPQWVEFKPKRYAEDTFSRWTLASGISIDKININDKDYTVDEKTRIIFSPAGINPPFSIYINSSENSLPSRVLEGSPIGTIVDLEEVKQLTIKQNTETMASTVN